jgi:drug/metabolite transporter (DMT)-like permease
MRQGGTGAIGGAIGFLLASGFWGWNIPLTSGLLRTLDPFWIAPCRYVIAVVVLGAWVVATGGWRQLGTPAPQWRVALLGLSVGAFLLLFNFGLLTSHPITVAAVIAGSPVYVAGVARLMTGARLERGFVPACLLTVVGAGIAIYGRARANGGSVDLRGGEVFTLLSIVCWTVYSILAQRWFPPSVSQLRRTYLTTLWAIPWLIGFWLVALGTGLATTPNLAPGGTIWRDLVITAVFCTGVATVAWNNGVASLGIAAGAMWQNMVPVFAVLIAMLFYDLVPLPEQLLGGGVVLAGVLYMQWQRLRRIG